MRDTPFNRMMRIGLVVSYGFCTFMASVLPQTGFGVRLAAAVVLGVFVAWRLTHPHTAGGTN